MGLGPYPAVSLVKARARAKQCREEVADGLDPIVERDRDTGSKRNLIVIGGIGGSGTRLVSDIVSQCGFYLGSRLNGAHDNLWFTFLLKRSYWFGNFPTDDEIVKALKLFERATITGLSASDRAEEFDLLDTIVHRSENHPDFSFEKLREIADELHNSHGTDLANYAGWGWKEPNTHIFLPQIAAAFKGARYIHVIRNGLDMAFSGNQQQVRNWCGHFGISLADGGGISPSRSLDFWIEANRRAIDVGRRLLKGRFHLIKYETLCVRPADEIDRLVDFLGVKLSPPQIAAIKQIPKPPPTIEQDRNSGIAQFSQAQIEAVQKFGFKVFYAGHKAAARAQSLEQILAETKEKLVQTESAIAEMRPRLVTAESETAACHLRAEKNTAALAAAQEKLRQMTEAAKVDRQHFERWLNRHVEEIAELKAEKVREAEAAKADRQHLERQLNRHVEEIAELKTLTGEMEDKADGLRRAAIDEFDRAIAELLHARGWSLLPAELRLKRQAGLLKRSGLFDAKWYLECNKDVVEAGADPAKHYIKYGLKEGRAPNAAYSGFKAVTR